MSLEPEEAAVADALASAWNLYLELRIEHPCDLDEFKKAIHAAQALVLMRPGRRELGSRPRPKDLGQ